MRSIPPFRVARVREDSDGDNRFVLSPNSHGTRRPRTPLPSARSTASHQCALRRERWTHRSQQHLLAAAAEPGSLHLARAPGDPLPRRQVLAEGDLQGQRLQRQRQRRAARRRGGTVATATRSSSATTCSWPNSRPSRAPRIRWPRSATPPAARADSLDMMASLAPAPAEHRRARLAVRHLAQLGPARHAARAPRAAARAAGAPDRDRSQRHRARPDAGCRAVGVAREAGRRLGFASAPRRSVATTTVPARSTPSSASTAACWASRRPRRP